MGICRLAVTPEMLGICVAMMPGACRIVGSDQSNLGSAVILLVEGESLPDSVDVQMVFERSELSMTASIAIVEQRTPTAADLAGMDGYETAFYEIAAMLGIGARSMSPSKVWGTEMRPKLAALLAGAGGAI